jgi:hypothetical protein
MIIFEAVRNVLPEKHKIYLLNETPLKHFLFPFRILFSRHLHTALGDTDFLDRVPLSPVSGKKKIKR